MIGPRGRARVFVHRAPVDMRRQYEGLWALVTTAFARNGFDGDVYVFIGKSRRRAKALWWDGTGLCLLAKRLDRGRFIAPWEHTGTAPLELTATEFALLLEGCELVGRRPLSPPAWSPTG